MKDHTNKGNYNNNRKKVSRKKPDEDIRTHARELKVYRIELEKLYEELRKSQQLITESRNKYDDLFDFSPIGYFMLNRAGVIIEANLTGAALLGRERSTLIKKSFPQFIARDHKHLFRSSMRRLFEKGVRETCEITLIKKDGTPFYAHLESVVDERNHDQCRLSVSDINRRTLAEEELFREKTWLKSLLDLYRIPELSHKDITSYIIEECIRISESELAFFGFIDEDKKLMTAHLGAEKTMEGCAIDEKKPLEFPCGDAGIWAEAIRQRKPVIVNGYTRPDHRKKGLPKGHLPLTRLMSIPIVENGKASAIATVANKKQDYSESDFFRLNFFLENVWGIVKRKWTEEALRQANERLEMAQKAARAGVWDWDVTTGHIVWSSQMFNLFGLDSQKTVASFEAWEAILHPEDREKATAYIDRALREKIPLVNEYRIIQPSGQVRWISALGEGTYDDQGRPTKMNGICIDITERKRAEEALYKIQAELEDRVIERSRELDKTKDKVEEEVTERISIEKTLKRSETLLQKIMEHMPVGIWIVDHNGKIISGNRASQEIWGGARYVDIEHYGEYKGWSIDTGKLINPHEWGAARAVTKGEISLNEEIEIECFDGTHKFILHSAVPLINEDGNITGAIIVNQDVTELKQAERKRLDDAVYARSLIEASLDPLVTISAEGKIMDVNKATESATGLSRERLIGSDFADHFTDPDMARKGYKKVFSKGFVRDYPLAIRNISGKVMEVLYNASLYRNESGEIQGILAAARDMTDHVKMEEAVHESETLYSQFFQNSVAGSFRTIYNASTGEARRIDCNEAHARILGFERREEALDHDIKDIFPSDHEFKNYFHELLENKILRNYRLPLQQKDGKRIWVLLNAGARTFKDDLIMIEGTMVDISDLVHAEKNLKDINEQLGLLTTELIMTEERERRKISVDLHDNIGQTLALTKIKLESLKHLDSKYEFEFILDQIEKLVNQSIQQARSLMTELSPSILYELGFNQAIEWLGERMEADYGLQVIVNDDLKKRTIDEEIQVFLFRAVRELLLNVVKHAGARKAYVALQTVGKNIQITIKDKGIGFDIFNEDETSKGTPRFGLLSIKERIKHIGGLLEIRSSKEYGTSVTLVVPRKNPKKRW